MTKWKTCLLGDEIELAYGKALPEYVRVKGNVPVFGSNGIVGFHDTSLVSGPGIIIGRKGSVGEVAYSSQPFWPIDTSYFVVNKGKNNWKFLFYLLKSVELTKLNRPSPVPGLNRQDAYSLAISFPSIDEQEKIADVLDCIAYSIELENQAIKITGSLKNSIMRSLFTKGLRGGCQKETDFGLVPGSWNVDTIGNHYSITSGGTPSRNNPEYWNGGTIPWVKSTDINYSKIWTTNERITKLGVANSAAKLLAPGAILMAMYGQGVTRGRVATLEIEATCNQACAAMYSLTKTVDQQFLFYFLTYHYENIRRLAHGGQQQNLNLEIIRNLPLAFPENLTHQLEIVSILESIDQKIDIHKKKQSILEDLFKSLLHKLMTSEIRVDELDLSVFERPVDAIGTSV